MRRYLILLIFALPAIALAGCGERAPDDSATRAFDAIAVDAVYLYTSMHPLRSSRLAIPGADSMLFTYSEEEIRQSVEALDTLLAAVASLPADDLDEGRIDESILLTDWIRGERFALTQSRTCLDNPFLYCWIIGETVTEMPLRPWPPYDGEREAWIARLRRIPALVENASARLDKPGGIHLEESRRLLSDLRRRLPDISEAAEARYGGPVPELGDVRSAIGLFLTVVDRYLGARTSERTITGQEEMSLILKYSEHLDFDGARMIKEAEKTVRRLSRQVAPENAAVNWPGSGNIEVSVELADSILGAVEEGLATRRTFGKKRRPRSAIRVRREGWRELEVPANPSLTLPVIPAREAVCSFVPGGQCVPDILVRDRARMTLDELTYEMLLSSSLMTSPDRSMCRAGSSLRRLLGSTTHSYTWKAHNIGDLTGLFPERRMMLARIQTTERLAALARMIITFRLHSGRMTPESAAQYLRDTTPLDSERIAAEVRRAAISPVASFEGIAIMTAESILKKATTDRQAGTRPRDRVRRLLLDAAGIPPYLLMLRMRS